jgi:opacity protein-like surface antigen
MKKILFAVMAVIMYLAVMGQDKPKSNVPNPEVYVGSAFVLTNTEGEWKQFTATFSPSYTLGVRFYVAPKFSLNFNYTSDTLNLDKYQALGFYDFDSYSIALEWWVFENAYFYGSPTYFTSKKEGVENKWGWELGAGLKVPLTKHWYFNSSVGYGRVENFILPVNTGNIKTLIGYKF